MAADFLASLDERPGYPPADADDLRTALGGPLPEKPVSNWQTSEDDLARAVAAFKAAVYAGQAPAR